MSPHNFYVKLKLLNVTGISTILKNLSACNEIALAVKGQEESDSAWFWCEKQLLIYLNGLNNFDLDSDNVYSLQICRFGELFVHKIIHDDKVFAGMVLEYLVMSFKHLAYMQWFPPHPLPVMLKTQTRNLFLSIS